ncbi:histidine kinase osmosensor [Zygosaccharomyces mellis]|uniref:histidine kinase n=1 Tax=Zygosaccharomyces mellis TaxID=42258 RepID=A0A4C2EBV5_9SACH|nr:histidine kinase osmosensor [Zygosaccharomyces mellis]
MWMRRLTFGKRQSPIKLGIRAQLTALVSIVALLSLIILAVSTGVYFTDNYKSLRSERLYMAAQLKSTQIDQNLNYMYYQCYWLSSRDTLQEALANYVAGNKTYANWVDSGNVIQKFLTSSGLFSVATIYDSNFMPVLSSTNNGTGNYIPDSTLEKLMPLSGNSSLPSSLQTEGILTNPVLNGTSYLMSMSLPIFANPSIILTASHVYGYITVIMSADSLKNVFEDTTALEKSNVAVISAVYDQNETLSAYNFVFAPFGVSSGILSETFAIKNGTFLSGALRQGKYGALEKTRFLYNQKVAVGYSPCSVTFVNWIAVVLQSESVFMEPATKLTKIISGTVVGIGVFVCLVTFPLAHWAVKPIVRLQKATELITEGRGLRASSPGVGSSNVSRSSSFFRRPSNGDSSIHSNGMDNHNEKGQGERGHRGFFATNGSINHSVVTSTASSGNEALSDKSKGLTTSANLIEARVPVYKRFFSDELSELTDTFNTMTDALDQHYALLEDRVRARTRQLEAAKIDAEAANEAKTVFIANISHELRTPLNGILGMTAISMEERDIDKIQNSLKLIFRSGELLLHILTELLTFSKNVLKRTKLEKRNFSVTDVALQIKSIFGKVAKDQRVKLSITLYPNLIRTMVLFGDSNRIIQIVMNLVSNALKFTPVDGKVNVRMSLLGEYDTDRSQKENYKSVYVVPGTEPQGNVEKVTEGVEDNGQPLTGNKGNDSSFSSSNRCSDTEVTSNSNDIDEKQASEDLKNEEENTGDADEISSFSTSTSSYNDTVFHSQFKKTPKVCDDSSEDLGIEVEHKKTWVISIVVEDTGPGIDSSLHESVFEPFVQGDQALSRQYGGTGLGLSICRQLANMMHGTMELESKLGVGSRFTFTVPLTQKREINFDDIPDAFEDEFNPDSKKNRRVKFKIAKSLKSKRSKSSLMTVGPKSSSSDKSISQLKLTDGDRSVRLDRPFLQSTGTASSNTNLDTASNINKILIAEDNHVNQEVIKRMLNLEGIHNIELVCDGQEALDKVKQLAEKDEHYNLIFMDVQMPNMDGLLSTRMIRNELNYQHSIVALTAFADDSNIKECLDAGMDGFLAKPIKRAQLRKILEEFCTDEHSQEDSKEPKPSEDGNSELLQQDPQRSDKPSK